MPKFIQLNELRNKKVMVDKPSLIKTFVDVEKVISKEQRTIDFVISTSAIDRDTDKIDPSGWYLDNYLKNPVVLWAHDSDKPPVGKSVRTVIEGGKLISTCKFAPKELSPFADMIFNMYLEGYLNAVSVGFKALEYSFSEEDSRPWGMNFIQQELLEYSCVPVPSNPEALIDAKNAGFDTSLLKTWAKHILEDSDLLLPRSVIDELKGHFMTFKTKTVEEPSITTEEEEEEVGTTETQEDEIVEEDESTEEVDELKSQLAQAKDEIERLKSDSEDYLEFDGTEEELVEALKSIASEKVRQLTGQLV